MEVGVAKADGLVCSAGRGRAAWTVLPGGGGGAEEDDDERDGSGGGRGVELVRLDDAVTGDAEVLLGGGSKGGAGLVELFAAIRGGGGGGGFPLYGSQFVLAI